MAALGQLAGDLGADPGRGAGDQRGGGRGWGGSLGASLRSASAVRTAARTRGGISGLPPNGGKSAQRRVSGRVRRRRLKRMSAATAILFPGQGSQTARDARRRRRARDPTCSSSRSQIVGEDPFARADEGTNFAQPAIFCASLAGWEALGRPAGRSWPATRSASSAALVAAGRAGRARRAASWWRCAAG